MLDHVLVERLVVGGSALRLDLIHHRLIARHDHRIVFVLELLLEHRRHAIELGVLLPVELLRVRLCLRRSLLVALGAQVRHRDEPSVMVAHHAQEILVGVPRHAHVRPVLGRHARHARHAGHVARHAIVVHPSHAPRAVVIHPGHRPRRARISPCGRSGRVSGCAVGFRGAGRCYGEHSKREEGRNSSDKLETHGSFLGLRAVRRRSYFVSAELAARMFHGASNMPYPAVHCLTY